MSGKQILIKNGMVFTGKGFKRSLRLGILGYDQLNSFCDYFPRGSRFMLIYIEDSLIGSNFVHLADYMDPRFVSHLQGTLTSNNPEEILQKKRSDSITFEMLLRSIPLLSKVVSEKYYKLFHHNNRNYDSFRTHTRKKLSFIKNEFHRMVEEAYIIISESIKDDNPESEKTYQLIKDLLASNPEIDLNKLVYEYVELNLYDKMWSQLLFQFNYPNDDKHDYDPEALKFLTHEKYNQLSCLSLNQLEVPIEEPWFINSVLRRISLAIDEFSRLSDPSITSSAAKREIISKTVTILTKKDTSENQTTYDEKDDDEDLVVDADTLVGMLIMVVVHSKVVNLEAHLYYIKNFNSEDVSTDGYFNYILSNLDAVIYHLSSSDNDSHRKELTRASQENYEFWAAIQKQDVKRLKDILASVQEQYPDGKLPAKSSLKSRNINGESCLMFAVKTKNPYIFNLLVDYNEAWFSVEDILFNKNTSTGQSMFVVSLIEEAHEISKKITQVLFSSAEPEEQIAYFNSVDNLGRSAGHHLFHYSEIIATIGPLIDWEMKDLNHHTPLFSICRCYDHLDYQNLVIRVFRCVYKGLHGKGINFDKHMDKNGNTLLHIILKGLQESQILNEDLNLINVNQVNNKSMTPLTLYVKYSRADNLETLLSDKRIFFYQEEPKNLYNVFDYLSFSAGKPTTQTKVFKRIERLVYAYAFKNYTPETNDTRLIATNARFDPNSKDWVIFFRIKEAQKDEQTVFETLDKLRQMVQLFELANPFVAFPHRDKIWMNYYADKQTVPVFSKYRINRLLETINLYLNALVVYSPDQVNSFYRTFTHNRKSNKSAFDTIKDISNDQERIKKLLGEVMLSSIQITEIETFLNYTWSDLELYKKHITKINKLLSVYDIKLTDARCISDRFLVKVVSSGVVPSILETMKFQYIGGHRHTNSYSTLFEFTNWIELAIEELLISVSKVLIKLDAWREIFGKIQAINTELRKYENKAHLHSHDLSTEEVPENAFFTFGLENKKSRYKRLLLLKAEEVKNIMSLNSEIRLDHDTIAINSNDQDTIHKVHITF
ncbi:hypothetical protein PSN45_003021 [Yamadazyma tenuis]|uniref:uncharacterized protein n=1 Tax=Candida tenuis TaxID=2315449 RepID=UPI0027A5780B|nr:hypothetical protein PSN45_003021 [Yamadazyma tenuis]